MHSPSLNPPPREPWYRYGVAFLFLEMTLAIAVCLYAFYLTFHGADLPKP